MWRQPKNVWIVAFASVIAFMGIGLVDPILKPIAEDLGASASQVSLLFTSYMVVMAVAMLVTGWVSSRIGAKKTLVSGLAIIVVGSALAGSMDSINGIVGWRGVWGLGNALFISTALATIVKSARGSIGQAIILYEAALGVGIAAGPLVGGELGSISWRGPFFGVAVLMTIALLLTLFALPATPPEGTPSRLSEPFRALRHRGLLTVALTSLFYNFGFFTLLAFTPFAMPSLSTHQIGLVFFGWGLLLAFTSVVVAPRIQAWLGTINGASLALLGFAVVLGIMALRTDSTPTLVACVIVAGAFIGVNNTLITEAVMKSAPVERSVASAAYSFVRFGGGAIAPYLAGKLGERYNVHVPFWVGAAAVVVAVVVLSTGRTVLRRVDEGPHHGAPEIDTEEEAQVVTVADA